MSQIIQFRQLGQLGRVSVSVMILAACSSVVRADRRGALELAHGIYLVPPAAWHDRDRTRNSVELVKTAASDANTVLARTVITTESRSTAEEAIQRLGDIAAEQPQAPTLTTIGDWPAIERRTAAPLPRAGGGDQVHAPATPPDSAVTSTVAVAVAATIVRFETMLAPGADPRLFDEILARVRQLDLDAKGDPKQAKRALEEVRRVMRKRLEVAPPPPPAPTAPHAP